MPDQILRSGHISAIDRQIGLAYGAAALRRLVEGHQGELVAIHPPDLSFVPLADAVNHIRTVPPDGAFIQAARGLGIALGD